MRVFKFIGLLLALGLPASVFSQKTANTVAQSTYSLSYVREGETGTGDDSSFVARCTITVSGIAEVQKIVVRNLNGGGNSSAKEFMMNNQQSVDFKRTGDRVTITLGRLTIANRDWEISLVDKKGKTYNLTNRLSKN